MYKTTCFIIPWKIFIFLGTKTFFIYNCVLLQPVVERIKGRVYITHSCVLYSTKYMNIAESGVKHNQYQIKNQTN